MGQIAIIIPTTRGLARVQQLRVDHHLHHAVMTVNFRTERASVTLDYAEYVARDSGIISSLTHEHRYRVKISRDIETGASWKLGMLAAHVLSDAGALAEADTPTGADPSPAELLGSAKRVVWATGDVSDEFGVMPVAEVKLKLERSSALFDWCAEQSVPIDVFVPAVLDANPARCGEVETALDALTTRYPNLRIRRLTTAPTDLAGWLESVRAPAPSKGPKPASPQPRGRPAYLAMGMALAAAVAIAIGAIALGVAEDTVDHDTRSPEATGLSPASNRVRSELPRISVTVEYDANGLCFENSERLTSRTTDLSSATPVILRMPAASKICKVEFRALNEAATAGTITVEGGLRNTADRQTFSSANSPQPVRDVYATRASAIRFAFENSEGSADLLIKYEDDRPESGGNSTP